MIDTVVVGEIDSTLAKRADNFNRVSCEDKIREQGRYRTLSTKH